MSQLHSMKHFKVTCPLSSELSHPQTGVLALLMQHLPSLPSSGISLSLPNLQQTEPQTHSVSTQVIQYLHFPNSPSPSAHPGSPLEARRLTQASQSCSRTLHMASHTLTSSMSSLAQGY